MDLLREHLPTVIRIVEETSSVTDSLSWVLIGISICAVAGTLIGVGGSTLYYIYSAPMDQPALPAPIKEVIYVKEPVLLDMWQILELQLSACLLQTALVVILIYIFSED